MSLCSQAQCLNTQKQLLRSEWIQCSPQISQGLDACADDECDGSEGIPELEPVVALRGVVELREPLCVLAPVELAAVDNDAANCSAVSSDPFGGRMYDYIRAVVDWSNEVASCTECVVYDDRDASLVCDLGDLLEVGDVV